MVSDDDMTSQCGQISLMHDRTPYWMTKLDHKFGDDGVFWMRFEDMLREFPL
jgi:hypothetical protein